MADSIEPKKETVRITVPPQQSSPSSVPAPPRDTVRIHLPTRPPASPPAAPAEPPSPPRAAAAAAIPEPVNPPLKKDTARITVLPDPPAKPAVQMKKTQPLINLPPIEKPAPAVTVAPATSQPEPQVWIDQVPMPLCWALAGISAAVLILQIWNYLS